MNGHRRGHYEHYASVLLLLLVLMGSSTTIGVVVTAADKVPEKYRASFEAAQSAILAGFSTVLDAERSGASVSLLTEDLNTAQHQLSRALTFYAVGDSQSATMAIAQSQLIAQEVTVEAKLLKATALAANQSRFLNSVLVMIVGGAGLSLFLLLSWKRFRKGYVRRLRGSVPELAGGE
jgi:hypothetical protein